MKVGHYTQLHVKLNGFPKLSCVVNLAIVPGPKGSISIVKFHKGQKTTENAWRASEKYLNL